MFMLKKIILFHITYPNRVHLITVNHTHFTSTYLLLTHSVNLTDQVFCVDNVNKASALSLVPLIVKIVLVFTYYSLYLLQ